jgi:hypothetical protein
MEGRFPRIAVALLFAALLAAPVVYRRFGQPQGRAVTDNGYRCSA